jgi:hypothetical protein
MRSNIFPAVACLLFVFHPSSVVHAQDPYPAVAMKVDLVAWGDGISGLSVAAASKKSAVTALAFSYSKPVPYAGPCLMEIYQNGGVAEETFKGPLPDDASIPIVPEEKTDKAEKLAVPPLLQEMRKKNPDLVAIAMLPVGSRRATVLLAPGPDKTFQTFVIDDDPTKLPFGKVRMHNLTPVPIAIRCKGAKTLELKPKETAVAVPENRYITYELACKEGEEWKILKSDMLRVAENEQVQMAVVKSNNKYFMSSDGSMGGTYQVVVLRRAKEAEPAPPR